MHYVVTEPGEQPTKGPIGFRLRHKTKRMCMVLVPLAWIKYPEPMDCPTCRVKHPYKTTHLHLEPDGTVLVSRGVLLSLQRAGLEFHGLELDGAVQNPPPLSLTQGKSREEINQANRAIKLLGK